MRKLTNKIKALWADESAQGATEYILLLAVVVVVVIMFQDRIKEALSGKLSEITGAFSKLNPGG
jgi:Flp pilus assembly pilin Flp